MADYGRMLDKIHDLLHTKLLVALWLNIKFIFHKYESGHPEGHHLLVIKLSVIF